MQRAALTEIPRFDTGYWTYYSLAGDLSPLDYQEYVVLLLHRLAALDSRFAPISRRFGSYAKDPPAFRLASGGVGKVRFWLSKPASVEVQSSAGPTRNLSLSGGWYDVGWPGCLRRAGLLRGAHRGQGLGRESGGGRRAADRPGGRLHRVAAGGVDPGHHGRPAGLRRGHRALRSLRRRRSRAPAAFNAVRLSDGLARRRDGARSGDRGRAAGRPRQPRGARARGRSAPRPTMPAAPRFTAYAVALAQQLPATRDLLLGPPPTVATAAALRRRARVDPRGRARAALPSVAIAGGFRRLRIAGPGRSPRWARRSATSACRSRLMDRFSRSASNT